MGRQFPTQKPVKKEVPRWGTNLYDIGPIAALALAMGYKKTGTKCHFYQQQFTSKRVIWHMCLSSSEFFDEIRDAEQQVFGNLCQSFCIAY